MLTKDKSKKYISGASPVKKIERMGIMAITSHKSAKRLTSFVAAFALIFAFASGLGLTSNAIDAGEYEIDVTLSAYINAMGGVEFAGPMVTGSSYIVDENGDEYIKLYLTKYTVTIYGVTCDAFIDATPNTSDANTRGVENGTIGIYLEDGTISTDGCSYTESSDTAEDSNGDYVNYADSLTFKISDISTHQSTYYVTFFLNSNMMGLQFCNSNSNATATTYPAYFTVDWDSLVITSDETTTAASTDTQTADTTDTTDDETTTAEDEETVDTEETESEAEEETSDEETTTAAAEKSSSAGLVLYLVDDDDEDGEEEEESSEVAETEESGSSYFVIILVVALIIVAVIAIIAVSRKKNHGDEAEEPAEAGEEAPQGQTISGDELAAEDASMYEILNTEENTDD